MRTPYEGPFIIWTVFTGCFLGRIGGATTFASAKVVAPPILPWKHPVNCVSMPIPDPEMMTQYDAILDPVMMT